MPTSGPEWESPFKDYYPTPPNLTSLNLVQAMKSVITPASLQDSKAVEKILAEPKVEGVCEEVPEKELDRLNVTARWLCLSSAGSPVKISATGGVSDLISKCDAWLRKDETLGSKSIACMLGRIEQALRVMVALSESSKVTLKITTGFIPTDLVWNKLRVNEGGKPIQLLLVLGCEQAKIVTPSNNVIHDRFQEFQKNNGKEILALDGSGALGTEAFKTFIRKHPELGSLMMGTATPDFLTDPGNIIALPANQLYVFKAEGASSQGVVGRAPVDAQEKPGLCIQIAA